VRYRYTKFDETLRNLIASFRDMLAFLQYLVLKTDGDVDRAVEWMRALQDAGYLPGEWDLDEFERKLEEEEIIRKDAGARVLTKKGERGIRRASLEAIFGGLTGTGLGDHPTPNEGSGGREPLPERRGWEFGDDLASIDFSDSIKNVVRRTRGAEVLPFEEDLSVAETEANTSCATAILIDISHSMVLYGEDRITPAKQVALALSELILTKFSKDSLDVILFGDEARRVEVGDLPYINAGPYHTNTQEGLRFARRTLERRKQPNKQIFLVTDGKPTVIRLADGKLYRNVFGLDPVIVARTLDEAAQCRRRRIVITTFMVASDPYLQKFVDDLTERNRGRAYFTSPDRLGNYLLHDFIQNRRKRVR
jgi:Ca-activated chloride channel homolog